MADEAYYGKDNLERVAMCLSCEKPVCNNCLERVPAPEGRKKKRVYRPRRKRWEIADTVKG